MSVVWGGRHIIRGTEAAIKVLRPEYAGREPHRSAFFAEARNHAKLSHPGILRILDVGEVDEVGAKALPGTRPGAPFIAMERAAGSLEDDLPLANWTQTYSVLLEILNALAHAHARGVVHRDLKPGNVMRVPRQDGHAYRVGDFGLAHGRESTGEADVTMGATAGTPMYMAPEQINGFWRDFGPETDLYALGCVTYRLVSGRPPFDGDSLFQVVRGHTTEEPLPLEPMFPVPQGLEAWIRRLMQKNPHDRYRRAADAAHALRDLASGFRDPDTSRVDPPEWPFGELTLIAEDLEVHSAATRPGARRGSMAGDGLGLFDLTEAPLVGREEETRRLTRVLLDAREHRGASVVILRGPPGVGLTRLATGFATRMDELGLAYVHRATHTPIQAEHEGLAGLLENHFATWGLEADAVEGRVRTKLRSYQGRVSDDAAAAVIEMVRRSREPLGKGVHGFRTSRERSALLDAALWYGHEDRPRLFLFDDIQWGRESLEFVRDRVDADAQAVFVLTVQSQASANAFVDGVMRQLEQLPATTTIELAPPSPKDIERFAASLLELAPGVPEQIAAASGRDFGLARQIVGSLLEDGELAMGADGFGLTTLDMPATWDDLWSRRLAAVQRDSGAGEHAFDAIELAAELGPFPDAGELIDALNFADVDFDARVLELMFSRGLLQRHGEGWAFCEQSLVEHIRQGSRSGGRVSIWSEACAAAIEQRPPTRDRASRIAWHRLQAGEHEQAFEPLRLAIQGFATADPDRAEDYLRWWRESCDALELEPSSPRRIDGVLMAANVARVRGQVEIHRRLIEDALRRSRLTSYQAGEAWALLRIGQTSLDDGDLDFALDRLRRAEAKFRAAKEHEGRAHALFGAAFATMRKGDASASIGDYRAAIEIFETIGKVDQALVVMSYLAYSHLVRGDFDAAENYCRRAIDDARRLGDRATEFESTSTLGEVARFRGDYIAARDLLTEVLQWRNALGLRDAVLVELSLALVELGAGNYELAVGMLERCESGVVARGIEGRLPLVLVGLAVAELGRGNAQGFRDAWSRVAPVLERGVFLHIDVMWCGQLGAQIAASRGEREISQLLNDLAFDQRSRLSRG